jgi:preprotein translocase subunit SecE
VAGQLGSTRYVLAGFFASAIAVAYVVGRAISTAWNKVAESQWAVDKATFLTRFSEDDRDMWGTIAGAVIGLAALVYVYRRQDIRAWVNDAASELAKVTWPSKKEVTSNTIIVIVASLVATLYLALLDRFWGFVTNLVYGI